MDHLPAKSFWQDYRDLLEDIKKKARKSFRLFKAVPRHTSFHTHKILDASNPVIFEGYIDKSYRFTFTMKLMRLCITQQASIKSSIRNRGDRTIGASQERFANGSDIWNNGGDCAELRNSGGSVIDTRCYP